MYFGECLKLLLSILNINYSQLSKAINVDNSLVNRWINDKRIPSSQSPHIENICNFLSKNICSNIQIQRIEELYMVITGTQGSSYDVSQQIKIILTDACVYSHNLNKKVSKEANKNINKIIHSVDLSNEDKVILGKKEIFKAAVCLLEKAENHKNGQVKKIYITYCNKIEITKETVSELVYLRSEILKILRKGWSVSFYIRLDNNINRTVRMIHFFTPLINHAGFRLYYLKNYDVLNAGAELLIIPETGALLCLPCDTNQDLCTAIYFNNNEAIEMFRNYISSVIHENSNPLFHYYPSENFMDYDVKLLDMEESIGNRFFYRYDFGSLLLTESLYRRLLKRKGLFSEDIEEAVRLYQRRLAGFLSNLDQYVYNDIYSMESMNHLLKHRKYYLYWPQGAELIDMDEQDIIELLENVVYILEKYTNYNIAFTAPNKENQTNWLNLYCLLKEHSSVVLEVYDALKPYPDVRLFIEEPLLVKAYETLFYNLLQDISPLKKDKQEIILYIKKQLNSLKKKNIIGF